MTSIAEAGNGKGGISLSLQDDSDGSSSTVHEATQGKLHEQLRWKIWPQSGLAEDQ